MKVTCEITSISSNPEVIRIHSASADSTSVELEIDNKKYKVNADELVSAVNRAKLNCLGM